MQAIGTDQQMSPAHYPAVSPLGAAAAPAAAYPDVRDNAGSGAQHQQQQQQQQQQPPPGYPGTEAPGAAPVGDADVTDRGLASTLYSAAHQAHEAERKMLWLKDPVRAAKNELNYQTKGRVKRVLNRAVDKACTIQ